MTSPATGALLHGVANEKRAESLRDSARSTPARPVHLPTHPDRSSAPTAVPVKEGVATASSDNRTASHSTDPHQGDRRPLHVLTTTIPARAADARPSTHDTPEIDRSRCPGASHGRPHGTASAASKGCTCPDARRELQRIRYLRKTGRLPSGNMPGIGAQRRARALAAAGWTLSDLAAVLGKSRQHVSELQHCHDRGAGVRRTSHNTLAVVYTALAHRPGPGLVDAYWEAVRRAGAVPGHVSQHVTQARRAVHTANTAGWATAAEWAGIDIDDPDAKPRPAARIPIPYRRPSWVALHGLPTLAQPGQPVVAYRAGQPITACEILTDQDVWAVRDHWVADVAVGRLTADELAAAYGITARTLADIIAGQVRPHLRLHRLPDGPAPHSHHNARRRAS